MKHIKFHDNQKAAQPHILLLFDAVMLNTGGARGDTSAKNASIKNGSAASDLPPEDSKKKSWADLTHLAHLTKLSLGNINNGSAASDLPPGVRTHDSGLRAQDSELGTQDSELGTQDSELRNQDSELRTQYSGPSAQNSGLSTQGSELRNQNSGISTQDSGLKTQDSGLGTRNSGLRCCLLYTSPSPRDKRQSRMPSSA